MATNDEKDLIRIDLTKEQKEHLKVVTSQEADAIELTVKELEERIAPRIMI